MFVLLKGATKEQAFKIGQEIAEAVTATNPKPVKLKFEKVVPSHTHAHPSFLGVEGDTLNFFSLFRSQVYLPCVLQTKKRYVGYMYESLDQKEPVFDAKGIETVRRDSCPAVSKVTGKNQPASFLHHFHCVLHRSLPRQLSFGSGLHALIRLCQSGSCQLRGHGWLLAVNANVSHCYGF